MTAILFGSISTIADTSELQRDAFNRAFAEHDLDWTWDRDEYVELLEKNGGKQRIADQAAAAGQDVDAEAVHATKSRIFQESLADADLSPRPGVVDTIHEGREAGYKIALVTTTSAENVDALVQGLAGTIDRSDFDLVVDASNVERAKPDESAYLYALATLGEDADACVAIEDNVGGVAAARGASVAVAAYPNENTAGHDFDAADGRVEQLSLTALRALIPST